MTKKTSGTLPKLVLSSSRDIPFSQLVLSQKNVRRVKAGLSIEDLAEDIYHRSLLQSLNVRAMLGDDGRETGLFEVPAGGRRFRALELLVKSKRMPDEPAALWDALTALAHEEQMMLLAHCVSLGVNALFEPARGYDGRTSAHGVAQRIAAANALASVVGLDMAEAGWTPTVDNYLGRVTKAVVRKTDNRRERFLSIDEVKQLGTALDELETEGLNLKALQITRLWVLTGCRRQEIAELKWDEIDFERGLLVLADSKTGRSVRPLAAAAVKLLKTIQRSEDSDYVFPADSGEGFFQGTKKVWPKIVKKAGLEGVTPHTLRHTMGAIATSSGEALALTGAILGHANMRSTMIYAHVEMDPSKLAADRVGEQLAAALGTGA